MIFYSAHGEDGACGPHCADWIAAEGVVEWDTFKRLFAFLQRNGDRKIPVILNIWGGGDLKAAMSLGKIIRDHGLDVGVGTTVVADCVKATDATCFALKRSGQPLDAKIDTTFVECDSACVVVLAGGVHRSLPPGAKVIIGPTRVYNRLAPNVSEEHQQGVRAFYGEQYRLYLTQMGLNTDIADIMDKNSATGHATMLLRAAWPRLGIVTEAAP